MDQHGQLLRAALGFARCWRPSYDRALHAVRTWLDFLVRDRTRRHRDGAAGLRPSTDAIRREGMARDLLHNRDGALAKERDGHRVGAHALAHDAAGGMRALMRVTITQ
jgi:hypothetical protein